MPRRLWHQWALCKTSRRSTSGGCSISSSLLSARAPPQLPQTCWAFSSSSRAVQPQGRTRKRPESTTPSISPIFTPPSRRPRLAVRPRLVQQRLLHCLRWAVQRLRGAVRCQQQTTSLSSRRSWARHRKRAAVRRDPRDHLAQRFSVSATSTVTDGRHLQVNVP